MLTCKTPYRISLFGGGTDFPEWFNKNGGRTISFAINKYCYVTLRKLPSLFPFKYRIRYFKNEFPKKISEIKHPSIKAILSKYENTKDNLEIIHSSDIPGLSGLGSSSAFTVSLINLISKYNKNNLSKKDLVNKSIYIERNILKENVGFQDQYACTFGGFNLIKYLKKKTIVSPIKINKKINNLIENCIIFYTGIQRKAEIIERDKIKNLKKNKTSYFRINEISSEAIKIINSQSNNYISEIAMLMRESWKCKKSLSNYVSNKRINNLYELGLNNGAIAGKILGAGGGGFMLFLTKNKAERKRLIIQLKKNYYFQFQLDKEGSQIFQVSDSDLK